MIHVGTNATLGHGIVHGDSSMKRANLVTCHGRA